MSNELYVYDAIGAGFFEEGVTAKSVRDELAKMDKKEPILVRINSPGGDVFDAVAIRTQLAQWPGGVNVQIDGLAASAASYIATVGKTVSMSHGGQIMIHSPWSIAIGNATEMRNRAKLLDKIGDSLVTAYADKSGKTADEIKQIMEAETWFSLDEALAYGLANESASEVVADFVIPEAFGFKNAPQKAEPAKQRTVNRIAACERQIQVARALIA